jgi:hypothetical protein
MARNGIRNCRKYPQTGRDREIRAPDPDNLPGQPEKLPQNKINFARGPHCLSGKVMIVAKLCGSGRRHLDVPERPVAIPATPDRLPDSDVHLPEGGAL